MKCLRKERNALLKKKEYLKSKKITPPELLDKNGKEIDNASEVSCFPTISTS